MGSRIRDHVPLRKCRFVENKTEAASQRRHTSNLPSFKATRHVCLGGALARPCTILVAALRRRPSRHRHRRVRALGRGDGGRSRSGLRRCWISGARRPGHDNLNNRLVPSLVSPRRRHVRLRPRRTVARTGGGACASQPGMRGLCHGDACPAGAGAGGAGGAGRRRTGRE